MKTTISSVKIAIMLWLTDTDCVSQMTKKIRFVCRSQSRPFLFHDISRNIAYQRICNMPNTIGFSSGAGTVYHERVPPLLL